jgi:hypothetical protein
VAAERLSAQRSSRPEDYGPSRFDIPSAAEWDAHELRLQLARRTEAALRLLPLACGCRDPETQVHLTGKCQDRRVA